MPSGDIIDTFQQRRQLEQALDEMTSARNEIALIEAARDIQRSFPAEMVLPALLKRLDTPDGQLRGGLARLAVLLPKEEIAPALRSYAGNRAKPPLGRTTAVMILERFLRERVPGGLVNDLQESDDAAFQSLLDAVRQGKHNRHVLLEYVTQMQEYGEEIAFLVMQNIDRLPAEDSVDLLRLIAQDGRNQVANAALARLEALADGAEPGAVRALYTLQPNLAASAATRVERVLRKQQFRGRGFSPVSPAGWRALLGIADPGGHMMVWLVHMPEAAEHAGFLAGLLVHPERGVVHDFFAESVDVAFLPAAQSIGQLTSLPGEAGVFTPALEAPFDVGRWLVQRALVVHVAGQAQRPLSGEYKLYSDLLWQFSAPQVDAEVRSLLEPVTPESGATLSPGKLSGLVDELMGHPVMAGWAFPIQTIIEASIGEGWLKAQSSPTDMISLILRLLDGNELHDQLAPALSHGLRLQAVWLHTAGEKELAQAASRIAAALPGLPTQKNPLLITMLERGLDRMLQSFTQHPPKRRK